MSILLVERFPTSRAEAEGVEEVENWGLMETSNPHTSTSAMNLSLMDSKGGKGTMTPGGMLKNFLL